METVIQELKDLLKGGPTAGKVTVYTQTLELILNLTDNMEYKECFDEDFLNTILKYGDHDLPYRFDIYQIFINLFSEENMSVKLSKYKTVMDGIISLSFDDMYTPFFSKYSFMLLSNITRSETNCLHVLKFLHPLTDHLHKMISQFSTVNSDSTCPLYLLSMVLCNLSQLDEVRKIFTKTNNLMIQKLVPFMSHENKLCRKGIVGLMHNCSFDTSIHDWLLGSEIDMLPRLLLPLAGPEQFDDEENDKLPIDLQYLPDTKTRETDPEIRKQLLETLNKLCTTKSARQYLRDHNTYVILRELHKWEEDPLVLLACENVVDILIRTENEIGIDDFNTIEIPTDLEDKFNKDLQLS